MFVPFCYYEAAANMLTNRCSIRSGRSRVQVLRGEGDEGRARAGASELRGRRPAAGAGTEPSVGSDGSNATLHRQNCPQNRTVALDHVFEWPQVAEAGAFHCFHCRLIRASPPESGVVRDAQRSAARIPISDGFTEEQSEQGLQGLA